jgi:hypothetical protein
LLALLVVSSPRFVLSVNIHTCIDIFFAVCRVSLTRERERKTKAEKKKTCSLSVCCCRRRSLKYLKKDSDAYCSHARANRLFVLKTPQNSTNPHITCSFGFLVLRFIVYTGRFLLLLFLKAPFYSRKQPMHILLSFCSGLVVIVSMMCILQSVSHSQADRSVCWSFSVRVCVCPFVLMKLVHLHR